MPYTTVVAATTITASWGNANVRDQVVTPFATASARTSAITVPVEGMLSYRTDGKVFEPYDGASWNHAITMSTFKRKTADETVNNSNTLQNDDALAWPVAASGVYLMDLSILYNSGTTPDIKFAWTYPTGLTMTWVLWGQVTNFQAFPLTESSLPVLDGVAAAYSCFAKGVVVVSSTAGTLQLQWAQNTTNASDTKVLAGSYGVLTRIG